jgi:zinc transporter 1/2/3
MDEAPFDPENVNLDTVDPTQVICYLNAGDDEYNGHLGARISSIFVILVLSTAATCFPVLATRVRSLRIPLYVYLFARYFGAGVIIATAFIHLLDPAYGYIGPNSCVGMTGGWAGYPWPPAIAMIAIMTIFLLELIAEYAVESRYGLQHSAAPDAEDIVTSGGGTTTTTERPSHQSLHSADQDVPREVRETHSRTLTARAEKLDAYDSVSEEGVSTERAFREQVAAFLILEFGVVFHSVIIGLNLGVVGSEFSSLYPVLVFHQTFEGLGVGARLSAIRFPARLSWLAWALCFAYGLSTPIAIAIGLALHNTYDPASFTANVVSGILDSVSAGILIYTGLVEMLARDFLFNPERTRDKKRLAFMLVSLYMGTGIMALIGKWA